MGRRRCFFLNPELVNLLEDVVMGRVEGGDGGPPSCLTLFTKYDGYALKHIVGTKRAGRMAKGDKSAYLFRL